MANYRWTLQRGSLGAVSSEDSFFLTMEDIEARASFVSNRDFGGVGLTDGGSVLGGRGLRGPIAAEVEKVLPRLKEAARRNEEAAREEFRRQCQAEEAAREAKRLRHNDLCLAWKDKDVATLCKMLGVEASSFEELNDLLRGRAVFAGRQDDLGGRRDYSCRELTTYQFTDESGWYIQWKETTGSWWGKD